MSATCTRARCRGAMYTYEELACRPIEHVIEELSCMELGRASGLNHSTGWRIKRGEITLTPEQQRSLRAYLESRV